MEALKANNMPLYHPAIRRFHFSPAAPFRCKYYECVPHFPLRECRKKRKDEKRYPYLKEMLGECQHGVAKKKDDRMLK